MTSGSISPRADLFPMFSVRGDDSQAMSGVIPIFPINPDKSRSHGRFFFHEKISPSS